MAGIAGGNIRFRNSVKVNGSPPRGESPVAVICGLGSNGREIERQIMRGTRTERRDAGHPERDAGSSRAGRRLSGRGVRAGPGG